MKTIPARRCLTNRAMVLLALTTATAVHAQTPIYKSHTGTSLTSGTSWNGGGVPTSTGIAAWTNTSLGAGLTLSSSASWLGIGVTNASSAIGITGSGTLTLGAGGINMASSGVNFTTATPLALGASQTWSVNSGQTLTVSGVISGAFAITESGAGKMVLSGLNTYTGGTLINGGILNVNAAETAGTKGPLGKSGTISFGGGTLQYTSADTADYSSRFSTAAGQEYSVDTAGRSVTWATALSSSGGSLTLNDSAGTGTLTLSGANSYTGNTTNAAGTLKLGAANVIPFGASAGNLVLSPGSGATATLNLNGNDQGINGLFSGSGAGSSVVVGQWPGNEGSGATLHNDSPNTTNWTMTIQGNTALWGYWQPGAYSFAQGNNNARTAETAASAWTSGNNLILQGDFNVCGNLNDAGQVFAGGALFGGGYFTAGGNSLGYNAYAFYALVNTANPAAPDVEFDISGIGSWTAALPVSVCNPAVNGGWNTVDWVIVNNKPGNSMTLQFRLNGAALGAPVNITGGYMQDFAGVSGYQGTKFYIGAAADQSYLAFQGSIRNVSLTALPQPSAVVDGASGAPVLTIGNNDASSIFAGVIENSGGALALAKTGAGTLTLSGFNTYTGGTSINGGLLNVNAAELAGTSGPLGQSGTISFGGGTLQYSSTDTADYSSRFSTAASQAYSVDTAGQGVTWGTGLTSSGGSLTITNSTGNGSLTLTGANTYTGPTAVNAGALLVNSPGSLAAGSGVTVATNATLGGIGTVDGPTIVNSGGILLPGNAPSIGALTFGGNLALGGTSIMEINKTAASADQIVMNGGTVTLGGNLTVANVAGTLARGDTFSLISGGTIAGGFSSISLPSSSAQYITGLWPVNEGTGASLFNNSPNTTNSWNMTLQGNTALWGYWQPGAYAFAQGNDNAETAETAASAWTSGNNLTLQADFNVCGNLNDAGHVFVGGGIFGGGYFISGGNAQGYNPGAFYAVVNTANPAAPDLEFYVSTLGSWTTPLPASVTNVNINGGWNTAQWVIVNNKQVNNMTLQFRLNGAPLGAPINITGGYMQDFAGIPGYQGTKFYIGAAADQGYLAFQGSIRNVSLTAGTASSLATGLAWDTSQLAPGGNGSITVDCSGTLAANAGANQTICSGSSTAIGGSPAAIGGSGSGYTYSWSPASGLNNTTLANPLASPAVTTTYTVTVTDVLGCTADSAVTITVDAAATASTGGNQAICAGVSTAGLGGVVGGGATGGTWSSSGTGAFVPDANTLNATYMPSGADIAAGTVLLTLTTTGQLAPCGPATAQVLVTISPAPTASAVGSQTICAGASTAALGGSVGNATGGVWSSSGTGTFTPTAATLNATYNPSAADIAAGTVMLTLTTTGQFSPCGPATAQVSVTINPAGTAGTGGNQSICAGNSTAALGGSVGGGATGGAWTSSGTGAFVPNATTLNAVYDPSADDITAGTVTLTLTSTGQLAPCGAASAQVIVTINALPAITNQPASLAVCAGSAAVFSVGATGANLTYQWQVSRDGGATFTNTSALDTNASYTNLVTTLDLNSNQFQVIVSGTCGPAVTSAPPAVLTVSAPATASAGGNQSICAGSGTTALGGSVGGGATGGIWSSSGTGAFAPDANTLNAIYTPSPEDVTMGSILLTLTATGQLSPCGAATAQIVVTINALPAITNEPASLAVCAGSPAVFSVGATGANLTYQWQVSSDGGATFTNTSALDTNGGYTNLVTTLDLNSNQYQVIVSGACSPAITSAPPAMLTVSVPATASAGGNQTICRGSSTAGLSGSVGGGATGGVWSSSGTGGFAPDANTLNAIYTPSTLDIAAGTVTLTLTSIGQPSPCGAATAQVIVNFNPAPIAAAGSNQTVCAGIPLVIGGSPTAGGGVGPYAYSWSPVVGLDNAMAANPMATVTNTTTYTVTVTDADGCMAANSILLTVAPQPLVQVTSTSGTNVTLVWNSVAGQTYRVQYKNNADDATWIDLTPDVTATGGTATLTDSPGAATQRFYQVEVVCP